MAKKPNKLLSIALALLMAASSTVSASAVAVDTQSSSATKDTQSSSGQAIGGKYATNPKGQVGKYKTITSASDFTEDMIIAQGVANDDPRIFRGSHEAPVYDTYALYSAWDDSNLYLGWQFTNVTDIVDPAQGYPTSDNGKPWNGDIPQMLAFDLGTGQSADMSSGTMAGGEYVWGLKVGFETRIDALMCFSSKPGVGQPAIFKTGSDGYFSYTNPAPSLFNQCGVSFKYEDGFFGSSITGIKKNGYEGYVPEDLTSDSSNWVDFLSLGHDEKHDTFYYMTVPFEALGVTKDHIEKNGIGVMHISTFGEGGIASCPMDMTMLDKATTAYSADESTSAEKEDTDLVTVPLARIGNGDITIDPDDPTDPPTNPPVDPDDPTSPIIPTTPIGPPDVTGSKEVTVAEGDKVTFTVDVTTAKKIGSYLMTTNYDANAFELDTTYSTDGVSTLGATDGQEVVNTTVAGQVKSAVLSTATAPYTAADGATLQTIQLTAKKAGTFVISYTIDEMIDESENDLVSNNQTLNGVTVAEKAAVNGETPIDPETAETGSTTASFKAGDTVEYYVDMKFTKGLYGFQTEVKYDSSVLEFVKAEYPNFDALTEENTDVAGKFSVIGAGSPTKTFDFTTEKTLVKVTFKALADATDSKISYLMKQTMDADGTEYFNKTTGQPLTADVATTNKAKVAGANIVEGATTASTEVTVKAGDKVNYWVEVSIPADGQYDVSGWTTELFFDPDVFNANMDFADGYGFASGTAAVDYVLGNSSTAVDLPGGSMVQATITDGKASAIDIKIGGMNFKGKTTKLFCIQLIAEKDATTTLSYRQKDMAESETADNKIVYVDPTTYQAIDGASFALKTDIISTDVPPVPTGKMIYLMPNANWIKSDARFAVQVSGPSGTQWISMTDLQDGYFGADIPKDATSVKFARMNPNSEANIDGNIWNYTSVMTIPTDGTNCYTIYAGEWNDAKGEWSVYISKASLKKLYLKPNANWIKTDARFAMQVFAPDGSSEWVSMEDAGDGYYTAYVPTTEYTQVKFARMNGKSSANTAANIWNYSSVMTFPVKADEKNCFFINDGEWNDVAGSWGVFTPTVYEPDALYIKPNLNWTYNKYNKPARFSAYLYGGESPATWVSLTQAADGNYKLVIPAGDYKKLQFARMDVNTTANNWESLWNDSAEMELPSNGTNRFVLGDDQWSSAEGTWDSITELESLYLKPNANWIGTHANPRFSAYLYGGESPATWVSMTKQADGTYKADMPEGHYTKVIFVRMNPNTTENIWDNNWNESTPQRIPAHTTNFFTLNAGDWNSAEGAWTAK